MTSASTRIIAYQNRTFLLSVYHKLKSVFPWLFHLILSGLYLAISVIVKIINNHNNNENTHCADMLTMTM